jgi:hypothetical protein
MFVGFKLAPLRDRPVEPDAGPSPDIAEEIRNAVGHPACGHYTWNRVPSKPSVLRTSSM